MSNESADPKRRCSMVDGEFRRPGERLRCVVTGGGDAWRLGF
ncbi:hypothetical protein N9B88_03720 [Rubripirellula sp.]|nr:hypothetical protein [Rubripirellula sp.]